MFRIAPIQDENTQRRVAEECGGVMKEGYFAYGMTDVETGEVMGFSQFEIQGEEGYISHLLPRGEMDAEAMFILGRQTMNFIDMCGAHVARAALDAGDGQLLHAIGFRLRDGEYHCDMTGFFDGHCDGH